MVEQTKPHWKSYTCRSFNKYIASICRAVAYSWLQACKMRGLQKKIPRSWSAFGCQPVFKSSTLILVNSIFMFFFFYFLCFSYFFCLCWKKMEKYGKRQSTCSLVKIYNIRVIFAFTVHLSFPFPCKNLWHITCLMKYWSDDITLYCKKWSSISAIHDWLISVVEKGSINKYKKNWII